MLLQLLGMTGLLLLRMQLLGLTLLLVKPLPRTELLLLLVTQLLGIACKLLLLLLLMLLVLRWPIRASAFVTELLLLPKQLLGICSALTQHLLAAFNVLLLLLVRQLLGIAFILFNGAHCLLTLLLLLITCCNGADMHTRVLADVVVLTIATDHRAELILGLG